MTRVRSPAVAGHFYPARADRLDAELRAHLGSSPPVGKPPKAIIAPHAGYRFSGPIAGSAFAPLIGADHISRVVILGPAHTVALHGMAITGADAWDTPLGRIPIDTASRHGLITRHETIAIDDTPHQREHAIEVELPFLQRTIGDFELLPIVVGETQSAEVADMLDEVWGGDETLIVISTDLSHYLDHEVATLRDRATCSVITRLDDVTLHHSDACGYFPLRGFLVAARRHGITPELLDRRTSADTTGDPDRVVGYAAFRVDAADSGRDTHGVADEAAGTQSTTTTDLSPLLDIAAGAIAAEFRGHERTDAATVTDHLRQPGAAFVSLHRGKQLLGCIGSLEAVRPLADEVADKAVAAAFRDPRLPPITTDDYQQMEIEVSVLTRSEQLDVDGYDALVAQVGPGDGITLEAGRRRATLLPVMWKQIPRAEDFLAALWRKAGLRPGDWPRGVKVHRYGSVEITDPGPRPPP